VNLSKWCVTFDRVPHGLFKTATENENGLYVASVEKLRRPRRDCLWSLAILLDGTRMLTTLSTIIADD
jgi:hypothetical protein